MLLWLFNFLINRMKIEVWEHPDRRLRFVYADRVYMIVTDEYKNDSFISESILSLDELDQYWQDCGILNDKHN